MGLKISKNAPFWAILGQFIMQLIFGKPLELRIQQKEWPAEFIVYSRDKYKNFLLTKFLKILQSVSAHQQLM